MSRRRGDFDLQATLQFGNVHQARNFVRGCRAAAVIDDAGQGCRAAVVLLLGEKRYLGQLHDRRQVGRVIEQQACLRRGRTGGEAEKQS